METFIKKNQADKQLGLGILIVVIGSVFLLRNSGLDIPRWILSWHTIMLGAGLWMGYRKNFQGSGWLALTIIGAIFTLKHIVIFDFEISKITGALAFIALGLYLMLKPERKINFQNTQQEKKADFSDLNT
ncbi:MAG: hypothetical protein ABWZ79_19780 [Pedobacter agri]|uniref:LiaF transmembrane domain-containing protein n=1 Tax=Pedobacter agri TaxID=454586 RepID=A0A9X3DCU5_9SPHI|nr:MULTISPECIES: hypothetical protein [Pedobacter]AZI25682.1 hypothetical protein EA772_10110 [Pedobacter sp. G11]MCX3263835.1 hypothetical protein [Pedobacter agri]